MGETRDQGNGAMELGKKMEGEGQLRKDNGRERRQRDCYTRPKIDLRR